MTKAVNIIAWSGLGYHHALTGAT